MSMTMEVSVWNQDFWVEESKIVRFEQMKNFNDPLNPDNPEKLVFNPLPPEFFFFFSSFFGT